MGTNANATARYGSADATTEYYRFELGDLHETWGMDTAAYYPTAMEWNVTYVSTPADAHHAAQNSCADHGGDACSTSQHVMDPHIMARGAGFVNFTVVRGGGHHQ
jgi:hypothetical protein